MDTQGERLTSDPIDAEQVRRDVNRVVDTMTSGGVGIIPTNVGYAIIATTSQGIRKIFEAKNRSYEKQSGMFGD